MAVVYSPMFECLIHDSPEPQGHRVGQFRDSGGYVGPLCLFVRVLGRIDSDGHFASSSRLFLISGDRTVFV